MDTIIEPGEGERRVISYGTNLCAQPGGGVDGLWHDVQEERPQLAQALLELQPGDVLLVTSTSELADTAEGVETLSAALRAKGVGLATVPDFHAHP